ncbi:hypothetical protein K458DRAFT_313252 [Lentithecium fluviatile CBS 122367]|uniref:Uncharacterized protein n=1 Tax=Lentithecium fluviatile CBS 122367 TaxID=1168545 RepID=A0A6G1IPQ5_9PLEO|nr:hypothetical protein K458DRAFT_313252 [Lentithecium fluviatile CBS 122367]
MDSASSPLEPRLEVFFLDSDPADTDRKHKTDDHPLRPWSVYWPPLPGSTLHDWLRVECPVALSWRFDPLQPFDRPWQKWTEEARQRGRACPSAVLPIAPLVPDLGVTAYEAEATGTNTLRLTPSDSGSAKQRDIASLLDEKIQEWGMRSVKARSFNYLAPLHLYAAEKPFHSRLPFLDGLRRTNIIGQAYDSIPVHDISGHESKFTLPESGFEFCRVPVPIFNWDVGVVRDTYLPLMEAWLKDRFKSRMVHIYTYNVSIPTNGEVDNVTSRSSKSRLKLHLPEAASDIENGRYRFIGLVDASSLPNFKKANSDTSMWRPLTGPDQDYPLAVCDYRTVDNRDLVPADVVFPHYCDEGYEIKYNRNHRWFYKREMDSSDVIVFKHYDSSKDEASFCPHSAFHDHTVPEGTPTRASVEIRAIVVG